MPSTSGSKPFRAIEATKRFPHNALSIAQCLTLSEQAKFLCEAQVPYRVIYVNRAWSELTGFQQHELVGGNLNDLQGPLTDKKRIFHMLDKLRTKGFCDKEVVINYTKDRTPICCELTIYPVVVEPKEFDDEFRTAFFLTTVTLLPMQHGINLYIKSNRSSFTNLTGEDHGSLGDSDCGRGDVSSGPSHSSSPQATIAFEMNADNLTTPPSRKRKLEIESSTL